jgi:excisionase family DNA binding protein
MSNAMTLSQAAAYENVHRRTVRSWIRSGRLPATKTPGGHYRVYKSDLDALPLSTSEFAHAVGIHPKTALKWAQSGKLAARLEPGGWRINAVEVSRFATPSGSAKSP